MSLADYLAKNYLTADTDKKSKKRKRKNKNAGLTIDDDEDASGWKKGVESDDEDGPTIVGSTAGLSISSKKPKKKVRAGEKQAWTSIGVAAPSHAQQLAADQAAADAIIASTEAERKKADDNEDAAPEIEDSEGILRMENGARVGLQTAAEVAAAMKQRQEEDRKNAEAAAKERGGAAPETIYRDASGRIINVAMKRAEARRKAEEEEQKKRDKEKAARGDVQNAEAAKRRAQLQDAKTMTLARHADDAELNDELKEAGRWNDPAAGFLRKKKAGRSITGKPLYKGSFAPNRYNIMPGHRWDGVDRGNGFEAEWFKSRNKKANMEKMEYAWQMDE